MAEDVPDGHQDDVVAVAAILTREGKIGGYALLEHGGGRHPVVTGMEDSDVRNVLHAVRQSRFAPAQRPGGQVVAVNMVWLFARTTVKASQSAVDLGTPLTRPVLAVPPPAAKPAGLPAEGASSKDLLQKPATAVLDSATA
jgi:hypothetical protein